MDNATSSRGVSPRSFGPSRNTRAALCRSLLSLAPAVLFAASGCGGAGGGGGSQGEPDPCAQVTCEGGTVCAPADGLCHCVAESGPVCAAESVCDELASACVDELPDLCGAGTAWEPGVAAFSDATADWGLAALGAQGVRLLAVDWDGDGWTDLAVRRGGVRSDDFSDPAGRHTWLLRNTGAGSFEDVTEASGVLDTRHAFDPPRGRPGEVWAFGDVDNDGDLDLYTGLTTTDSTTSLGETSEVMLQDGGFFSFSSRDNPLRREGENDLPAGASFVDVDRDGFLDLWVTQNFGTVDPQASLLFLGSGNGRFQDATAELGLLSLPWDDVADINGGLSHANAWSSAACDLNADGVPELLVSSYGRAPNLLWQGVRDSAGVTSFVNRSVDSGYAYDHRQDWSDNQSASCYCRLHPEAEDCEGVPPPDMIRCNSDADVFRWNHDSDREPYRLGGNSGTTACGDVDNDGAIDLLTTEIVHWDVGSTSDPSELLFNDGAGDPRFARPGNEETGLTREDPVSAWNHGDMTGALFDFDNDGWLDVYIGASDYAGNRGLLYHQEAPREFVEVDPSDWVEHNRSHGIAVADFDRDGDLDVVVGHSLARCSQDEPNNCYADASVRLLQNQAGGESNFVQLHLTGGDGTNRAAIGARVTLEADGLAQTREIGGGHGHYGIQHDLVVHFGLGASCEGAVTVRWPDEQLSTQQFRVQAGYRYEVRQGAPPVVLP